MRKTVNFEEKGYVSYLMEYDSSEVDSQGHYYEMNRDVTFLLNIDSELDITTLSCESYYDCMNCGARAQWALIRETPTVKTPCKRLVVESISVEFDVSTGKLIVGDESLYEQYHYLHSIEEPLAQLAEQGAVSVPMYTSFQIYNEDGRYIVANYAYNETCWDNGCPTPREERENCPHHPTVPYGWTDVGLMGSGHLSIYPNDSAFKKKYGGVAWTVEIGRYRLTVQRLAQGLFAEMSSFIPLATLERIGPVSEQVV